jgi:hypothetical protein
MNTKHKVAEPLSFFDILGKITQSAKIKRGNLREAALLDYLKQKHEDDDLVSVAKIKLKSPRFTRKTKTHEVDILVVDRRNQTVLAINSKSNGISGTDSAVNTVIDPVIAKSVLEEQYPGFQVRYVCARPDGSGIPEWTEAGIPTLRTAELLGGQDIDAVISANYLTMVQENFSLMIGRHCASQAVADRIMLSYPSTIEDVMLLSGG